MRGFSIEVTPRELNSIGAIEDLLPVGTAVFITWLPNASFEGTVAAARRIGEQTQETIALLARLRRSE